MKYEREYSVTDNNSLRQLCIRQGWFTCGDNRQYEKLFYANSAGWPFEEIVTMIWLCTDCEEGGRLEIKRLLKEARNAYLKRLSLTAR